MISLEDSDISSLPTCYRKINVGNFYEKFGNNNESLQAEE